MAKELTEDELNIRRKARRRLIGAAALTLAVVVILPMVLDSEPKPTGQDIDLRIPDPDKVGEFVPSVPIPEQPPLVIDPVVQGISATTELPKTPAVPAKEQVAGKNLPEAAPVKTPVVASKPAKVVETPKPKIVEAPKSKVAEKSAGTEGFVAQIGAYSNADTAKQELIKLKKWGFKAYTEKAGDKIRVRVGPYASREKAEKAGQLLEKHGLNPVILTAK